MADRRNGSEPGIDSGAALFTFDAGKRIRSWNRAAESLTGRRAETVVGMHCWAVLCGRDEAGNAVCHPGCSLHRLLRSSWPVTPQTLVIDTSAGARRVRVPMLTVRGRELFAALLLDLGPQPVPGDMSGRPRPAPALTARQRTVLAMLADGMQARSIAEGLQLSEMTVRNHIRGILARLGCSSQLAAVAEARRMGLVEGPRDADPR